ncbi:MULTISPECIES: hypothetical protein [unclassified Janthinobacterium]|uniref:hypothetical protein n=1 Tax=unclassified Janthinobacterium TaxID=2610881 RepID=UPI000346A5CA|nr:MULTISPECIES: hypothetical protein [unclassified Janthinobacterium]MEC5162893.1 hypothetical protein [Janthinobacterium sp. CG_S6]
MMQSTMGWLGSSLIVLACAASRPVAAAPSVDAQQRAEVIDILSRELLAQYIYPANAQLAIDAVRAHQRNGDYDASGDGDAFAALLTAHMRAPIKDQHFKVLYRATPGAEAGAQAASPPDDEPKPEDAAGPADVPADCRPGKVRHYSIGKTECLPGNIGYVEMRASAIR